MDFTSIAVGGIIGFIAAAFIFTPSGREVTRASGKRVARRIYRE